MQMHAVTVLFCMLHSIQYYSEFCLERDVLKIHKDACNNKRRKDVNNRGESVYEQE